MRKLVLLVGVALSTGATPASACDLEMLGGAQRYNPLTAMLGVAHRIMQSDSAPTVVPPEASSAPQPAEADRTPPKQPVTKRNSLR